MKITINKTAKRVLSLVLALTVLVGSLFVANVGVTFIASAATVEDTWDGTKVQPTTTDDAGNIIINNAEELAWVALQGGTATADKNYKVVDNAVFNMNGMAGITLNSNAAEVKAATKDAAKLWIAGTDVPFMGNFDGNGLVVYNINGNGAGSYGYAGLFPVTKQTADGDGITFKNVKVCASYFTAYHTVGAVIGLINAPGTSCTATLENLAAVNCYISDNGNTNANCQRTVSTIVGSVGHSNTTMNNCFASGNTLSAANIVGGFIGNTSAYSRGVSISNSVVIGTSPIPVEILTTDTNPLQPIMSAATYTNVYTDQTVSQNGVTKLTIAQMTGTEATKNMALDFGGVWFANTAGVPVLRAFHTISGADNGNGTHSETCADADCGLIGLTVNHLYNIVDYTTDTSSCVCGAFIYGTHDVWDGTKATAFDSGSGTEADPYIIKTVEQLFLMVRSTGLNADGTPVYYKVADSVNELYINDTRGFADQAAFEAAVGSLKNWSTGLTTEAQFCGDASNCYCTRYNNIYTSSSTKVLNNHRDGYVDYFGGRFDGNGVTIYGLYSETSAANHWNNGVGFVPMLTGDAVIKNVTFDTNYVKSNSAATAVITATVGIWDGQYNRDTNSDGTYETYAMCPKVDAYAKRPENCNAAIINVAVRNSYLGATNYSNNSFVSGFVSSIRAPKSLKFDNCMFDGTNATFTDNATGTKNHVAFVTTQESNTNSTVTGCASVAGSSTVTALNSYTDAINAVVNCYELDSNKFTVEDAPLLNWTAWEIVDNKPTPKVNDSWIADYYRNQGEYKLSWRKNKVLTSTDVYGTTYEYSALRGNRGVFNAYNTLQGSGTETDPYIINDADTLYMIIASGGTHYGVPQHFKLGCNIDLEGKQWVDTEIFENTTYDVVFYQYVPFAGTIDGDGHTIYNLYTANDGYVGFIPELDGGTVKNLHFRNAYVASSDLNAGVIVGAILDSNMDDNVIPQIINCSVENSAVYAYDGYGDGFYFVGYDDIGEADMRPIENCYFIGTNGTVYVSSNSNITSPNEIKAEILAGNTVYTSLWYLGGNDDAIPHLIANAKAQPCADIDGDGVGEEYTTSDATALKSNLLWKDGYDYIYGDVTGNGTIDMRDLAALQREMTGQETIELDGFWPNVKAGKFSIYYNDKDNYDFARKLELYLESKAGVDVPKTFGISNNNFTITLKTEGAANAYSVNYDAQNAKLTISGGSFTAVEEAVDQLIANTTAASVYEISGGTIAAEKNAITVNGSTYYYAWGDEFNSDVNGTVNYDNWILRNKGTDSTPGIPDTEFEYIRAATNEEAIGINQVKDGKLTLKRGFTGATATKEHKFYMSGVSSLDSMLFKQGYLEMVATVPSDGYSFPAWWLLTHVNGKGNNSIDNSLYSKVYERNERFNGTSISPTGTDVTSYKYKVPTQTLEMDLFEIIQRPTETWSWGSGYVSKPSNDHNIKFNVHKWYNYSLDRTDTSLIVYDLDWSKNLTSGSFSKLLTATGSNGENYKKNTSSILFNTNNLATGGVNGAVTYEGDHATMQYNMANLRSNEQITERRYGFLWTEDKMTFTVYNGTAANASVLYTATVTADQMNFGGNESYYNNDNYGFGQYAYMLIENHIFTAQKDGNSWIQAAYDDIGECDLVIDYVRIYQLDGARAIITPESEPLSSR